jgi:hypothetical protein
MFNTYYQKDYSGGLNDSVSSLEIKRNQSSLLRNWDITYEGRLTQRDGLTLVGNTLASPITGIGSYIRDSGNDLLCTEGTNLYYLTGGSWTQLSSNLVAGNLFHMENVQAFNKVYIANQNNTIKYWDRASTILNSSLIDLAAGTPTGNVLRWHKNHMFVLNNYTSLGVTYPNRIGWSALGDPETYDTANDYFDAPGDGRVITAVDLGDNLVIFKERSIQYLSGWGDTSWQITGSSSNVANIDEQVGIAGIRSATRVGNEIWFIDNQAQIRRIYQTDFDAFRKDIISKNIQGTLAGVNKSQLSKSLMWSHDNKVYAAFPNGSDNTNSIVCVFDIIASLRTQDEAWTTYTGWFPSLFADHVSDTTPDLYMGDALTGSVYLHSGTSDNGVAIDCYQEGKDDGFEKDDRWKRYGFGYFGADSAGGATGIDLYASVDQGSPAKLLSLDVVTTGSTLGPTGSFLLGPTGNGILGSGRRSSNSRYYFTAGGGNPSGKLLRMGIGHNALGEKATAGKLSINYKLRQLR